MMMMLLLVLNHVHSLSAPTATAGRFSRARLGVESPASSAAWLTDQFSSLSNCEDQATSVLMYDDFSFTFEEGSGPTGSGLLGIETTVDSLSPEETEEETYAASMIPDEAPENVFTAKFSKKEDPTSGLPIFGVVGPTPPKLILCVSDLDASIEFYTRCLGMNLMVKRSMVPAFPAMTALLAFSPDQPRIELRYLYGNDDVHPDVTLNVQQNDCEQIAAMAELYGGTLGDDDDDQLTIQDPDGYTISLSEL